MPRFRLVGAILLATGCSGMSEPREAKGAFAALLDGASQVFVLGIVENQLTDPIITFDHHCTGVHRQTVVRDTIELHPDGGARRAIHIEHRADGAVVSSSYLPATGTWSSSSPVFGVGSHVTLSLMPISETYLTTSAGSYLMPLRVTGDDRLTTYSALGGTCAGSGEDGRVSDFTYTNR
jgi:hypothetical protein